MGNIINHFLKRPLQAKDSKNNVLREGDYIIALNDAIIGDITIPGRHSYLYRIGKVNNTKTAIVHSIHTGHVHPFPLNTKRHTVKVPKNHPLHTMIEQYPQEWLQELYPQEQEQNGLYTIFMELTQ